MPRRLRPLRSRAVLVSGAVLTLAAAGCAGGGSAAPPSSATTPPPAPTTATPTPTPTPTPSATCAEQTYDALSPEQRLGQLVMVGFDTNASLDSLDREITSEHIGNVIYLGGWDGAPKVTRTSEHLQGLVSDASTGGVGLMIAADQEGGEVHQLRGQGFTRPPSALQQAQMSPAALTKAATGWAEQMKAAGVNVNLAPVTDTVPKSIGTANGPIGKYHREYGSSPAVVEKAATAFIRGMLDGGVEATVKHFPGLGRIRNNTDFSSTGITDDVTTRDDPYLQPFRAGVEAGAGLVMVGSARYSKIDPGVPAMFSKTIVTDMLRGELGYDGVVITDDVRAKAVESTPVAQRGVLVISAGGDIVLTGDPAEARPIIAALRAKAGKDDAFAAQVKASVQRVLALKDRMGLLPCSAGSSEG